MAVYKKLAKIQASVRGLTKDKAGFNYEYVTGDKLLSHIRPQMIELGLLLMPEVTDIRTETITYDSYDRNARQTVRKTEVLNKVSMRMTWVDTEDGDTVSQVWAGTGMNAFDKGFGSALTYGERYYLLKLFHIPTDKDDVDAVSTGRDADLQAYYCMRDRQPFPTPAHAKPSGDEIYWGFVNGAAEGRSTPKGTPMREAFIKWANPTGEQLKEFDQKVDDVKSTKE